MFIDYNNINELMRGGEFEKKSVKNNPYMIEYK